MKILAINSNGGPDYLADLILSQIIYDQKHDIFTNHLPAYLFDDWGNAFKLYGRGYTVFTKIEKSYKQNINILDENILLKKLHNHEFDLIIYTSIWRNHLSIMDAISIYEKNRIIVIDGEDHTNVLNIAPKVKYYKRELTELFSNICLPISFSFPSFYKPKINIIEKKKTLLAPCIQIGRAHV